MSTVKSLRQYGWKVRVMHSRYIGVVPKKFLCGAHRAQQVMGVLGKTLKYHILPKGGETKVEITPPKSELSFIGIAYCGDKDTYSKKIGVDIALNRALNNYQDSLKKTV